jgi:hypothetical protein
MNRLAIQIERFVDEHFPGFVECAFIDSEGTRHEFVEKVPVVSGANLNAESEYPQPGHIDCTIAGRWLDEQGRRVVRVNTEKPWSVESVTGMTIFAVYEEQISST